MNREYLVFFNDVGNGVEHHDLYLYPTAAECRVALMAFFDHANKLDLNAVMSSASRKVTIGNSDAQFAVAYKGISIQYAGKYPPPTHVYNTHILRDYDDRERFKDLVRP